MKKTHRQPTTRVTLLAGLAVASILVVMATIHDAHTPAVEPLAAVSAKGPGTSREHLAKTAEEMSARLAARPDDAVAVIRLSEALLRLQRVNNDQRAVTAAQEHLRAFLDVRPDHYEAGRLLAAVLLSQHKFGEAVAQANRLIARDPRDAWNYGALGDGYLELGDYDRAFEAFDRMGTLQPGPPAYARVAYALELKGDLAGAQQYMQRAADGTTPNDSESQAWHFVQLGSLLLQQGHLADATREFERALATFPAHPMATDGLARVRVAAGDLAGARQLYQEQLARTPTSDLAAVVGDLSAALGDSPMASRYHQMAEQIERGSWANGSRQPQVLARQLAERNRDPDTAVTLAEEAARRQRDIFTMDTLAWAYHKAGRTQDALKASAEALRTGTRDARLLYHAAEIRHASGDADAARELLRRIPSVDGISDVIVAAELKRLLRNS
jgi:tetratricopeptide (TPR) repeat protein